MVNEIWNGKKRAGIILVAGYLCGGSAFFGFGTPLVSFGVLCCPAVYLPAFLLGSVVGMLHLNWCAALTSAFGALCAAACRTPTKSERGVKKDIIPMVAGGVALVLLEYPYAGVPMACIAATLYILIGIYMILAKSTVAKAYHHCGRISELPDEQKARFAALLCLLLLGVYNLLGGIVDLSLFVACALCTILPERVSMSRPEWMGVLCGLVILLSSKSTVGLLCLPVGLSLWRMGRTKWDRSLIFGIGCAFVCVLSQPNLQVPWYLLQFVVAVMIYMLFGGKEPYAYCAAVGEAENYQDKLMQMSDCLSNMAQLNQKISRITRENSCSSESYQRAAQVICRNCPMQKDCWQNHYATTCDCLMKGYNSQKDGQGGFPTYFRCNQKERMLACLRQSYLQDCASRSLKRTVVLMRGMCADQLMATSKLLYAISKQKSGEKTRNISGEISIRRALENKKIKILSVRCETIHLEQRVHLICQGVVRPEHTQVIADALEDLLEVPFSLPQKNNRGSNTEYLFVQQPPLSLEVACVQRAAEQVCGDCYTHFCGEDGCTYFVLSDGMGTGKQAAVFGEYTCSFLSQMLACGMPKREGIDLLGASLSTSCDSEGVATVDLLRFDCFEGKAYFAKAGAVPTLVVSGDRVTNYGDPSLPIGILHDSIWEESTVLSVGDILVMCSDGAEERDKFADILPYLKNKSTGEIADMLMDLCVNTRDDCTIAVIKVVKNTD